MNNDGLEDAPIPALRDQEIDPSAEFLGRVRRSIHRRTTVNQVASFGWELPKLVLLELAGFISGIVSAAGGRKDSRP